MATISLSITPDELTKLGSLLEKWCGIVLTQQKAYLAESRLGAFLMENGFTSFTDFCRKMDQSTDANLRDKIVDLMTTNETLWFRDKHPFTIMREVALPKFEKEAAAGKRTRVRIWSAACSTGQEPYSLAMTILDAQKRSPALRRLAFEILATDISASALQLAFLGRYDRISMSRGMEESYKRDYFAQDGDVSAITPEVKKLVQFKKFNLQDSFTAFGTFDVIMCRNVLIYFSDDFKTSLFAKFRRQLPPDGFFMVGASESISTYSQEFKMNRHQAAVYYHPSCPSKEK